MCLLLFISLLLLRYLTAGASTLWEAIRLTTMRFRIGLYGDIRVSGQDRSLTQDDSTDLHLSDIDHYVIDQGCRGVPCRQPPVGSSCQNAFCNLFMVL